MWRYRRLHGKQMKLSCRLSQDNPLSEASAPSFSSNLSIVPAADTVYRIPEATPISNQMSLGSCAANATADALEILLGLEKESVLQISRLFIYWNARKYEELQNKDEGTLISLALQSLVDFGVCREDLWDYRIDRVFSQPTILAYKEADDNRIDSFYRIRATGDELLQQVEAAIRVNHPVVFGVPVGKEMMTYSGGILQPPAESLGNHALIVVGVDSSSGAFLIRNSWGEDWGEKGHCWFSKEYLLQAQDLHVPTRMPGLLLED